MLKLFNTFGKKIESFKPVNPDMVKHLHLRSVCLSAGTYREHEDISFRGYSCALS